MCNFNFLVCSIIVSLKNKFPETFHESNDSELLKKFVSGAINVLARGRTIDQAENKSGREAVEFCEVNFHKDQQEPAGRKPSA